MMNEKKITYIGFCIRFLKYGKFFVFTETFYQSINLLFLRSVSLYTTSYHLPSPPKQSWESTLMTFKVKTIVQMDKMTQIKET